MTRVSNTFEGGTATTALTAANSGGASGTAFNSVVLAQGGTATYEASGSVTGMRGSVCAKFLTGTTTCYAQWDTAFGTQTDFYSRSYWNWPALPPGNCIFIRFRGGSPLSIHANVRMTATGTIQLCDSNNTARYTSSHAFAGGDAFRIETHYVFDTVNGHLEARLFWGANINGSTPDEVLGNQTTSWDTGGSVSEHTFGVLSNETSFYIVADSIVMDTAAAWIGPESSSGGFTPPAGRFDIIGGSPGLNLGGDVTRENHFEGGTNGATLTTGNTGGTGSNAFDSITIGAGNTLTFDSAQKAHGSLSAKIVATGVNAYAEWDTVNMDEMWGRLYLRMNANPAGGALRLCYMADSTALSASVNLTTGGKLYIGASDGTTVLQTANNSLAVGSWIRVEWHIICSAGIAELKYWTTMDDSGSPQEYLQATGASLGSQINVVRLGHLATAYTGTHWIDDAKIDTNNWIGPFGTAGGVTNIVWDRSSKIDAGGFHNAIDVGDSVLHAEGNPNLVVSGTDVGGYHRSVNNGDRWEGANEGLTGVLGQRKAASILFSPNTAGVVWAASSGSQDGGDGPVFFFKSTNGGKSWTLQDTTTNTWGTEAGADAHPRNTGRLIAEGATANTLIMGTHQGLARSTDSGQTWTITALAGKEITGVARDPNDATKAFVTTGNLNGGAPGFQIVSSAFTASPSVAARLITTTCFDVTAVNEGGTTTAYIANGTGGIRKWTNAGGVTNITPAGMDLTSTWCDVAAIRTGSVTYVAVGCGGQVTAGEAVWRSLNGGSTWAAVVNAATNITNNENGTGAPWWYAVERSSLRISGGGWDTGAIRFNPNNPDECFAAGRGGIWRTKNFSAGTPIWHPCVSGIGAFTGFDIAISPNDPKKVVTTATDWSAMISTDKFNSQPNSEAPDGYGTLGVHITNADKLFIFNGDRGDHANQGSVWSTTNPYVAQPTWTNEGWPSGTAGGRAMGGFVTKNATGQQVILAFGEGYGIRRKVGTGGWTIVSSQTAPINTFRVDFAGKEGSQYIFMYNGAQGLYRSQDYGATWTQIWSTTSNVQYSAFMTQDPIDEGLLYVSTSTKVWKFTSALTRDFNSGGTTKTVVKGAWTRGGLPALDGGPVGPTLQIHWDDIEAVQGTRLRGPVEQQLQAAVNNGFAGARIRPMLGSRAPQWAKNIGGGPITITVQDIGQVVTIPDLWDPNYQQAVEDFYAWLAIEFDSDPRFLLVFANGAMSHYGEPLHRNTQGTEGVTNMANMLAAGYTIALDKAAQKWQLDIMAPFQQTPVGLCYTPLQMINPDGTRQPDDVPEATVVMDYHLSLYGPRTVLQNNELAEEVINPVDHTASVRRAMIDEIFNRKALCYSQYQTAGASGVGNIPITMNWAIDTLKATAIEMPINYDGLTTVAQQTDWNTRLKANPSPAGTATSAAINITPPGVTKPGCIAVRPNGELYLHQQIGGSGGSKFMRSKDKGASWADLTTSDYKAITLWLYSLAVASDGDAWIITDGDSLYRGVATVNPNPGGNDITLTAPSSHLTISATAPSLNISNIIQTQTTQATLIDMDGFQHGRTDTIQSGSGLIGEYDLTSTPAQFTFDAANARTTDHWVSLKFDHLASTTQHLERSITAGIRDTNGSFYIKANAAPATSNIGVFYLRPATAQIQLNTSGQVRAVIGAGTAQSGAVNICDGNWHRIDWHHVTSGATATLDVKVDGTSLTQATLSTAAADQTGWRVGSPNSNTGTGTVWLSDLAISATSADYPIGDHKILPRVVRVDGTHSLGTTNAISGNSGETTNLWQLLDEWQTGPDTTTYITYASTTTGDAASNFAEFKFQGSVGNTIVSDVMFHFAGFADGIGGDTATVKILSAHGGTLIDTPMNAVDHSGSSTVLGYYHKLLARPSGGWDNTKFANMVAQWGFSTDTNNIPRASAMMVEYCSGEIQTVSTPSGRITVTGAAPVINISTGGGGGGVATGATARIDIRATTPNLNITGTPTPPPAEVPDEKYWFVLDRTGGEVIYDDEEGNDV